MAGLTDLFNAALVFITAEKITSPDEDSEESRRCLAVWEQLRDEVLRAYAWHSATRRKTVTPDAGGSPEFGWTYRFTLPADCIRVIGLSDPATAFSVEGRYLLSSATPAEIIYTARIDPEVMDALLFDALAKRLAAELAFGVTNSATLAAKMFDLYQTIVATAQAADGRESMAAVAGAVIDAALAFLMTQTTTDAALVAKAQRIAAQRLATARDRTLADHDWSFATARAALTYGELITIWADQGGNIWTVNLAYTPNRVSFGGTDGTEVSAVGDVDAAAEWHFDASTLLLTIYSTADPGATARVDEAPPQERSYQYNLPSDSLRVLSLNATRYNPGGAAFDLESGKLITEETTAAVKHIKQVTDISAFPAPFTAALAARLAADICVAVTGTNALLPTLEALYRQRLAEAEGLDTIEKSPRTLRRQSQWKAARYGGRLYTGGTPNED